jgi:hypothetical protein
MEYVLICLTLNCSIPGRTSFARPRPKSATSARLPQPLYRQRSVHCTSGTFAKLAWADHASYRLMGETATMPTCPNENGLPVSTFPHFHPGYCWKHACHATNVVIPIHAYLRSCFTCTYSSRELTYPSSLMPTVPVKPCSFGGAWYSWLPWRCC